MIRTAIAAIFLAGSLVFAHAADAPAPVSTLIAATKTTITGQPIVVPPNPEVRLTTVEFAPGARLPVHKHLYPHYVYVLEGTLSVTNVETGKSFDLKQGSFFAEMIDTWHYGTNNTAAPLKLLVIDQVPQGTKTNVVVK
ncbi:MAG TPA: cupin domain-containing protein [Rhizomicrobium sp.]|nr:cupin domain-containing protein [Rhizomicrobium sp.]